MHTSLRSFLASAMLFGAAAYAADGDLDTTYNTPTGFNSVSFGGSDNVYGGILQSDGKLIVIGGGRPVSNQEMSAMRFNADGTLDSTFATAGKFSLDVNPATSTDRGTCGGLQSDGKIIIGGYSRTGSGNDDYAIIRLNTNGTLDTTFGTSGVTKVDFNGGSDRANALVVLPDNSIVLTGMSSDFNLSPDIDYSLAKLTPSGALDTTFGTGGKVTVDVGDQQDSGNGITSQSDGKILFCGQSFGTGTTSAVVGRLTAAGVLDTSFGGGDGLYTVTNGIPYDLRDVEVQSDGKIIVVGSGNVSSQLDGLMLRLTSVGDLDTTFNTTGIRTFPFSATLSDLLLSVLIQADGKYIAGGFWQNPTPNLLETVLVRVTSSGAMDSGFGTGGSKQIALGSGNNRPAMIGQASDGKILVALEGGASSAENFIAARFLNTVSVASAPEIAVTESSSNVADGGSLSFGTTTVGTPVTKTFTVTNSGTANLTLSGLTVPSGFTIAADFGSTTVAPAGNTTFQITMSAGAAATPSGSLSFTNNDGDENPYNFTISGTVNPAPAPEIAVTESAANVADGGSLSFGTTTVGSPVTKTFTVTNSGTANLTLSGLTVPSGFTIAADFGSTTVAPAGNTTFQITMSAGAAATPSGSLSFTNNDGDENPYNFTISGTVNPAPVPEIAVTESAANVADGGSLSFGTTTVGSPVTKTFTVTNGGTANLTLSGLTVPSGFTIAAGFGSTTVAPAGNTTFQITMSAGAAATSSGTLSFTNNDSDEGTYNFTVSGTVLNNNADLIAHSYSAGALSPAFANNVFSYSFAVPNSTSFTTMTAQKSDPAATVEISIDGGGFLLVPGITTGSLGMNSPGTYTFVTRVTAADGITQKSFTTVITRAGPPQTFDLAGNAASNTPFDGGETYIYTPGSAADIPTALAGGTLTIDATGAPGAAQTSVSIVDLGGGVFVIEIKDLTRTIGAPAGGTQVDSNTVRIPIGSVTNIIINGTPLADTFTLDLSLGTLPGLVTVNGNLPTTQPGDSMRVIGAYDDITYGPNGVGSGTIDADGTQVAFTGLEPLDLSGASILNLTVVVDPTSAFAGDVITTVAAVDAGVNTEITFADAAGVPNGLESTKIGALTGTLTIQGDNVDNDFFSLLGLGSAMAGHVSVDGRGGNADVIQVFNATFAVTGTNKNLSLKADFIGVTQTQSADTTPDDPGIVRATGNITLEADGDDTVAAPLLWGAGGVWGAALPAHYNATTLATRGNLLLMGHIEKTAGSDATLTLRANRHVAVVLAGASGNTAGRIISTTNKLHTIINSDRDALNDGGVSITTFAQVLTNGGDITIGGGADPAATGAAGLSGLATGVAIQGATVDSSGGNISIRGTGAALANGVGVVINSTSLKNSVLISSGAGNIGITGTGGNGTNGHAIRVAGDTSLPTPGFATIQSTTGTITLSGTSVIASGFGVTSSSNTSITSTGGAAVSITGISPGTQAIILAPVSPGTLSINSTNGQVTLSADTMNLNANTGTESITAGTGIVTLKPTTAGKNIALGSGVTDSATLLAIDSSTELPNITAATVAIGEAASGTLTVSSVISPSSFTTLALASGSGTTFDATSGFTADVTTASNFEKITVTGTATIAAGATFATASAGGYVWNGTDAFTFLDNDAADAITGTFSGPTLTNFLGTTFTATQSYTAGTGNDFVIRAPLPIITNVFPPSGPIAGGTSITITGAHFTGATGVTVGGTAATNVVVVNSGSITCDTPAHAAGVTNVLVTTPAGTNVPNSAFTYLAPLTPVFLGSGGTSGVGTGGGEINAPNSTASASLGRWESIRSGAVLASNGNIAFRGHMELGSGVPAVTVDNFQGIWKFDGTDTRLKARSGSIAPDASSALFDILPLNPSISPNGLISFYGALRLATGSPAVTASTNFGLWSEMGGGNVRLLLRKGDTVVPGKTFRSGFAVAASDVNTAALNAKLSSGTALVHLDVNTPAVQLTVVAEEGQSAPGGGTWIALDGNSSDPRLSANGDLGFIGWELVGTDFIQGIYSRLNTTAVGTSGAVVQARVGGTAPGTSNATFSAFERPTVYNGGMAFRGFLNLDGDNAGGTKGQGVWAGAFGALAPVVRTGDTNAQIPTIPAGSTVSSVWSPFSSSTGAITMRVGLSNGGETRAIMGSTGGTMRVIAKVGDAAPGLAGETFTNFDHSVIGDGDQVAFTASTNAGNYGIWKEAPGGGALSLVIKVGDTITMTEGDKVAAQISLPGITTDDRKFESRCMDATGRLLIHVTFPDGSTSLLLGQ